MTKRLQHPRHLFVLMIVFIFTIRGLAQTTIVNYDFNSGTSYATLSPALAGSITCTPSCTETFTTATGISSGSGAFTANAIAGNAVAMANSGSDTRYFTFQLGGSDLASYVKYKIYLQARAAATGATTIKVAYSTDGSTYTDFSTTQATGVGAYRECLFDLTGILALNQQASVYFRIKANGASGTGAMAIDNFQVQAFKDLTCSPAVSVTNTPTLTCSSTSGVITTTTAVSGLTYTWSPGGANTNSLSVSGVNTYTLKARNPSNGCSSTLTVAVTSNTATPTLSITNSPTITCTNTLVTITGTTTTSGATYSWSPGGAATSSISVSTPNTYTLMVTGTNGCTSTGTVAITSNTTVPTLTITNSPTITCTNTMVTITGTTTTSGATYSWSPGGATTSSVSVSTAGTYTLKVTGPNGCTSSGTVAITSNTAVPTLTITNSPTITCTSPTAVVTGTTTTTGPTYSWSPGTGTVTVTASSYSVTAPGTYTLKVTGTNGCASSGTVAITSNTAAPTLTITNSPTITCTNTAAILTGTSTTSGVSYTWSPSGGGASTATVTSAGTYTLKTTDPVNGCASTATVAVSTDTVIPNANAGANQKITCTNTVAVLTGTSTTAGASYSWSPTGSTTYSTSTASIGTFTLKVTGPNGCTSTSTAIVTTFTTPPNANAGSNQTITCTSTVAVLTGTSTTAGVSYTWAPSGGNTPTTTVMGSGIYTLTVTDPSNGCISTSTVGVSTNTAIPNVSAGSGQTITCAIPTVTLTGSSTTSGATFSWTPSVSTPTNAVVYVSTRGNYTLSVKDPANGCSASATVSVISKICPVASIDDYQSDVSKGKITLSVIGGISPYTFAWNGTRIPSSTTAYHTLLAASPGLVIDSVQFKHSIDSMAASNILSDLDPGSYPVTVYDQNNDSVVMMVSVGQKITNWSYAYGVNTATCTIPPYTSGGITYAYGIGQCLSQTGTFVSGDDFAAPVAAFNFNAPSELAFSVPSTTDIIYVGLQNKSDDLNGGYTDMSQKTMFRFNGNGTFDVILNSSTVYSGSNAANDRFAFRTDPASGNITYYKNEASLATAAYAAINTGDEFVAKVIPGNTAAVVNGLKVIKGFLRGYVSGQVNDVSCDDDCIGYILATGYSPVKNAPVKYELYSIVGGSASLSSTIVASGLSNVTFYGLCAGTYSINFYTNEASSSHAPGGGISFTTVLAVYSQTFEVAYKPSWANASNVSIGVDNSLTKVSPGSTGTWNAGASSLNTLLANQSGWIEWTAPLPNAVNGIGFSDVHGTTISDVDYGAGIARIPLFGDFKFYIMTHNNTMFGSLASSNARGSFSNNAVFRLTKDYAGNKITLSINGVAISPSFTGITFTDYVMDAYLQYLGGTINHPRVSFGCKKIEQYTLLKKKPDAGYYRAIDSKLLFKYDEEYADLDGKLSFNIYDKNNVIVCSNSSMPSGSSPLVNYGDNRYSIDLSNPAILVSGQSMPANNFYILEVINEKNEKWYLRFKK